MNAARQLSDRLAEQQRERDAALSAQQTTLRAGYFDAVAAAAADPEVEVDVGQLQHAMRVLDLQVDDFNGDVAQVQQIVEYQSDDFEAVQADRRAFGGPGGTFALRMQRVTELRAEADAIERAAQADRRNLNARFDAARDERNKCVLLAIRLRDRGCTIPAVVAMLPAPEPPPSVQPVADAPVIEEPEAVEMPPEEPVPAITVPEGPGLPLDHFALGDRSAP